MPPVLHALENGSVSEENDPAGEAQRSNSSGKYVDLKL